MIRILLADDHEVVRHGLKLLIDSQPDMEVIGEVGTGRAAVKQAETLKPTVIVLDISMPEMNGLEAARELAATVPSVRVVALTRYSDEAYVQALLGAGACAFVLKQSASIELLNAVRAAADGHSYLDTAVTNRVAGAFIARHAPGDTPRSRVSDRELEVLRLIAIGYSNKEIAARLDITEGTLKFHLHSIYEKLRIDGRYALINYARDHGLA